MVGQHTCSSKIATTYRNLRGNFSSLNYSTPIPTGSRDPGIGNSTIPNPGIENSSPGLQSLVMYICILLKTKTALTLTPIIRSALLSVERPESVKE